MSMALVPGPYRPYTSMGLPTYTNHGPLSQPERLKIVYINDTHEKYRAFPGLVSAFHHFQSQAAQEGRDVLKVAAGDWNISNEPQQLELNILLRNLMQLDFTTLGNHEFDGGTHMLGIALKKANFKTIATNLIMTPNSEMYKRYLEQKVITGPAVFRAPSGTTYGVVGLAIPNVKRLLNPDAVVDGNGTLPLKESIARLEQDIAYLEGSGINKIILVSHAGYDVDKKIARNVAGIDVIVGGHSHTELKGIVPDVNYFRSKRGEPVMVVQTGKDAHALGVLDVSWDPYGRVYPTKNHLYNPLLMFPPDPTANALIDRYLGPQKPMGWITEDVSTENARSGGENIVANQVADAIWSTTHADIGLLRGTELRSDLYKGAFTDRDLKTLLPFNDNIAVFQMTGADLNAVLDESARCMKAHEGHPGMVHPSRNLRYAVDLAVGKTISAQYFNPKTHQWEPLDPQKKYTVATGDFIAKNEVEYPVFKQVPIVQHLPFKIRDAFGWYIQSLGGRPPVFPLDGRIQAINQQESQPEWGSRQPLANQNVSATPPWNAFASAHGYSTLQTSLKKESPRSLAVSA